MKINLCIFDADPILAPFAKAIKKEASNVLQKITTLIPIGKVDIIIAHWPDNIVFGTVSGSTINKHRVLITLDVLHKDFRKEWKVALRKTIAHELYHIARAQQNKYPETLFENCVDEGLAVHFEQEIAGGKPPRYAIYLKKEALARTMKLAQKEFPSKKYSHNDWFHGGSPKKIPESAGYNIGYHLVQAVVKNDPHVTPSKLVSKSTIINKKSFQIKN